jgi:pimeloyl-ACP methyl ester carboxylesterase
LSDDDPETMTDTATDINFISAGSGPPLVMIHGNPATHTLWRPLVERLAHRHTIYAIDLPGFGGSPHPAERSGFALHELARRVLDWTSEQRLGRFDLIGHSFGGAISITLADMAPERVRSLALIAPLGMAAPPAGRAAGSMVIRSVATALWSIAPGTMRKWIARRGAHVSYGAAYTEARAREIASEINHPRSIASMTGLMTQIDYRAYSEAVKRLNDEHAMPLLLLGARQDRVVPFSHFEQLRSILDRATCSIFPEGGHVVIWQYPDEVARMILEFYESIGNTTEKRLHSGNRRS